MSRVSTNFMFRILVVLCVQVSPIFLIAQVSISGRILNDESGEAIANASVYLNNTTIGATTNAAGEYILKGVRPGIYEIIVSHVSYDMLLHKVDVTEKDLRFVFRIIPKIKQMRNIVVMTKDLRKQWMNLFRQYFIGENIAAAKTKILNEEDVLFERGETKSVMKAFSETPLIIENRELGYRIYFDLIEFYYDREEQRTYYAGYSRFEELDKDGEPRKKWIKNREQIYRGSTMHFYHSMLANTLEEQQFAIYLTREDTSAPKPIPGGEKSRINLSKGEKRPKMAFAVKPADIFFREDSTAGRFYFKWDGQLQVRYKRDPYGKKYLQSRGMFLGLLPVGVQSSIDLLDKPAFLSANGALENPLAVQYSGYWSNERMANLLPLDYRNP
jgi:hypothetical protein